MTLERENMLHHGPETERLFRAEEWESKLKIAEQKGYADGVKDERRRAARERRKNVKQKRETFLLILLFISITIGARWVYMFATRHIKFIDGGWFGAWLLFLISSIFKACTGDKELSKETRGNRSAFRAVLSGICEFWKDIRKNNKLFFMFILCTACLTGGTLGKFEVLERTVSATSKFGDVWIHYESKELKDTNNDKESERSREGNETKESDRSDVVDHKTETDQTTGTNELNGSMLVSNKSLANESVAFIEKSDYSVNALRRIEISEDELAKTLYLSSEEYGFVFLTGEEYAVEDWESQEEINDTVLQMIENIREKRIFLMTKLLRNM